MKGIKKIYLNPKYVFIVLSVLIGLICVLLLPVLYKVLTRDYPEGFDYRTILAEQIYVDGILGILAGIAFAVFGLFRFKEAVIIKLIRLFFLIIISLIFLVYITIKSLL